MLQISTSVNFRLQAGILTAVFIGGISALSADWRDEVGYTRLQQLAAADLPSAPSQGLTQVEASITNSPPFAFMPDTALPVFSGKTFTNQSAAQGTAASFHGTHVGTNFYGNTTSLITGNCAVDVYFASDWFGSGLLNHGSGSLPSVETRAVENHSWIARSGDVTDTGATDINKRLDFAINRDGFVCVVGMDNGASTVLPQLLGQSYHTISVGRDDGEHSAGFTTLDIAGRIKPDIVAPSATPEDATSWTTPMVASAGALLYSKLTAAPYSLTGADRPRVVKALLLASAVKIPSWANTPARPLDLKYGAGILNVNHAYNALRAGPAIASNSVARNLRGWSAESATGNSTRTYFFNVAPGAPSTPFSAALIWHRAVAKTLFNGFTATLANLNLRLHRATGFTVGALVAESLSGVDNVELVYQSALTPGSYALIVENTSNTNTPYALAWHSLPAVTIAATGLIAREIDLQAGLVTITRTGDTTLPLLVPLVVSGTAVSSSHFLALPATVTIPAGQASIPLQITPISDDIAQGQRTVVVSIAADFALVRDPLQTAAVAIEDKPFDAWRFANFTAPQLAIPAISSENADPDGDALPNLIEYALGLNPRTSSISTATSSRSGGYLTITATKDPAATDILWNSEVAADLIDWQPAAIDTNTVSQFVARDSVLAASAGRRFIRLKITRP